MDKSPAYQRARWRRFATASEDCTGSTFCREPERPFDVEGAGCTAVEGFRTAVKTWVSWATRLNSVEDGSASGWFRSSSVSLTNRSLQCTRPVDSPRTDLRSWLYAHQTSSRRSTLGPNVRRMAYTNQAWYRPNPVSGKCSQDAMIHVVIETVALNISGSVTYI